MRSCECGCGAAVKNRYVQGHAVRKYWAGRERVPQRVRGERTVYKQDEKLAALHLVRERGATEASRRLGIPLATLNDWKAQTRTYAYSSFVGTGREVSEEERSLLLAQLIHEQELETRFIRRRYRHNGEFVGASSPAENLDVLLTRSGSVARHLLEWLDPTFDEVAERLAA